MVSFALRQRPPQANTRSPSTVRTASTAATCTGVNAVPASLALLFAKGPEVAAWPGHVRKAWYESRTEAELARDSYRRITEASVLTVVEDADTGSSPGAQDAPAGANVATCRPASAPPRR